MKKHTVRFLTLIEIIILLGALALFALQNPNTLTLFLNYTTKHLGLSYDEVSGNLLKTVTVRNIRYHNKILSSQASIDWNIRALFTATLKIDEISVQNLDIPLTQEWIADLRRRFGSKEKKKRTAIPAIEVSQLVFSAKPFHNDTIQVSRIELQANDIRGNLQHIDIGFFSFLAQSDYADITALGNLKKSELFFEKLWLAEIDIPKITSIIKSAASQKKSTNTSAGIQQQIIKSLLVDNLIVYTKPLKYRHYDIKNWSLSIRHLYTKDLRTFDATHVYLDATTNMWRLSANGSIKANRYYTQADISLTDSYFRRFLPFVNHASIRPVKVFLTVDRDKINGKLHARSDNLLIKRYRDYQLAVPQLQAHVTFDFHTIRMKGDIQADIRSHYTPDTRLSAHIYYDRKSRFHYDGEIAAPRLQNLPAPLLALLQENNITFRGDTKHITANLKNPTLTADYNATDYKHARLRIRSQALTPSQLHITVPPLLKPATFAIKADIPVDYTQLFPLSPRFLLTSNLVDINASARLDKNRHLTLNATLKKASPNLLKEILPNLRQQRLFPLRLTLDYQQKRLHIKLKNRLLRSDITYHTDTNQSQATLRLDQETIQCTGNIATDLNITYHSASLRESQIALQKLYAFTPLPMDGDITLQAKVTSLSEIQSHIRGKWFVYEYKPYKFLFAEKISLDAMYQNRTLQIPAYKFHTYLDRDRYFFATKPSSATFSPGQFTLQKLWINNQGSMRGTYRTDTKSGHFYAKASNYHYKDIEGDFFFDTDLEMTLTRENTDIEGSLTINSGTIQYAPKKEHGVQDDDIIIVQDQAPATKEQDKLSLDISITTKEPVYYKVPNTTVKLTVDLKVWKELHKSLELLGIVKILSGTHIQSGKEFELDPSEILFGGDPLNPYLNIRAIHRSDPYTIYVNINGQLDAPAINFSATPYLNQSDILSILLFNTTTDDLLGSNQDSSKAAISMFGTVFAKEIVQNFGIKLDKLVLTTTEEGKIGVELGKKLTRKVTLIYINDIVQTIKVRYKLSDHFESDFVFSPDNSGIDIIYKDEY